MFVCIGFICGITVFLIPLSSSLIQKQEQTEDLKNYELTINSLYSSLASKQNNLAASLTPLFSDTKKYQSLCKLYQYPSQKIPTEFYSDSLDILSAICNSDSYCRGALILTKSGQLFQYNLQYEAIIPLDLTKTTKRLTPYRLQTLTNTQLENLSSDYQKPSDYVYGLCTSIFDYESDIVEYLGTLILLYSTTEFSNIVSTYELDSNSSISILDNDKNILYSSTNQYDTSEEILLNLDTIHTSVSQQESTQKDSNGITYYTSALYNNKFQFYTLFQIPTAIFSNSYFQLILFVLSIIICLSAILLYIITFRISDKKINTIQNGMKLVGKNNLEYRLPIPKANDEFTQIILSFNTMCDALQRNIEKAYLHEISQRKAELYAMQTSINPHFLYNALEQIRVHILKGGYSDSSQMLLLLSKMYRNQTRRNLYVTIADECNQSENLINFYMYRYGDFEYEFDINSSIRKFGIPKNTLQPLIENYFVHGYISNFSSNFLLISVTPYVFEEKTWIHFQIEDNGSSISQEDLSLLIKKLSEPVMERNESNGFALSNVNHRLQLVFGPSSCLTPSIGKNGGFCITYNVPAILPEDLQQEKQY